MNEKRKKQLTMSIIASLRGEQGHLPHSSASVGPWTTHLTSLGSKWWRLNWTNLENLSGSNVLCIQTQSKGINQR